MAPSHPASGRGLHAFQTPHVKEDKRPALQRPPSEDSRPALQCSPAEDSRTAPRCLHSNLLPIDSWSAVHMSSSNVSPNGRPTSNEHQPSYAVPAPAGHSPGAHAGTAWRACRPARGGAAVSSVCMSSDHRFGSLVSVQAALAGATSAEASRVRTATAGLAAAAALLRVNTGRPRRCCSQCSAAQSPSGAPPRPSISPSSSLPLPPSASAGAAALSAAA
eukprot:365498-Chlamydomonas_euryale.AAC.13